MDTPPAQMAPNVTPLRQPPVPNDTHYKWKALATPTRPMPPRICLILCIISTQCTPLLESSTGYCSAVMQDQVLHIILVFYVDFVINTGSYSTED
eukprot:scaffold158966_cov63-Attheya_sp.AAC.1